MKVTEYIIKYLEEYGIKHVFTVVGGGAMYLNKAFGESGKIKPVYMHNEQSCSYAAEGYSRANNYKLSVVCVTTGPGGLNALSGVFGAYTDSVPMLIISGQVATNYIAGGERQIGDQEAPIVATVELITKFASVVPKPEYIKFLLQRAIYEATTGRPGPVWLDIPLDVQNAEVNENEMIGYIPEIFPEYNSKIEEVISLLKESKKPLIIAGHGIRIAGAQEEFRNFINKTNIPIVTTFNGFDIVPEWQPNFMGRIGTQGTRAGNIILQQADLIICLGTRNNIRQVGYNKGDFAKNAKKIVVDIDKNELNKNTLDIDLKVNIDVKDFLSILNENLPEGYTNSNSGWFTYSASIYEKYPYAIEEQSKDNLLSPYRFIHELSAKLPNDAVVVCGNGTACVSMFQTGRVKEEQRIFWNSGCAAMGYAVPAAIGAYFATGKEVICIDGDGSFQMNIQELQTIKHYEIPIKIFVLNNGGYNSIYQTQKNYFNGKFFGINEDTGVGFPDLDRVADTYDSLVYFKISRFNDIDTALDICTVHLLFEVMLQHDYEFSPKVKATVGENGVLIPGSLENMYPFLSEEEKEENKYV